MAAFYLTHTVDSTRVDFSSVLTTRHLKRLTLILVPRESRSRIIVGCCKRFKALITQRWMDIDL